MPASATNVQPVGICANKPEATLLTHDHVPEAVAVSAVRCSCSFSPCTPVEPFIVQVMMLEPEALNSTAVALQRDEELLRFARVSASAPVAPDAGPAAAAD